MPKFERKTDIDAPIEKVWEVLTDPSQWPNWFPGIDAIDWISAMEKGGTFEWSGGDRQGTGEIVKFQPEKSLKIVTQVGKDKDSHEFKLKATGGFLGMGQDECEVEYTLDTLMGGGIITNFAVGGNPRDVVRVKKALHNFRRVVEGKK